MRLHSLETESRPRTLNRPKPRLSLWPAKTGSTVWDRAAYVDAPSCVRGRGSIASAALPPGGGGRFGGRRAGWRGPFGGAQAARHLALSMALHGGDQAVRPGSGRVDLAPVAGVGEQDR